MSLSRIFDVFSGRPHAKAKSAHGVPETTRGRILLWWKGYFVGRFSVELSNQFWVEMHSILTLRLGRPQLNEEDIKPISQETISYLLDCPGEQFLDFLEDLFRTNHFRDMRLDANATVEQVNELLRVDDLPYHVTKFVTETKEIGQPGSRSMSFRILAYPQVVMRESEILHTNAVEPALQLLGNPAFENANKEYLAAQEDYRKGDYSDCLAKCGSSFESCMKVLCHKKGWPYKDTDVASALIKTIIANTSLEGYFETLLIIVATLRNKLSSAHGAGTTAKTVPQHLARYALNITASAMVLLAAEAGL